MPRANPDAPGPPMLELCNTLRMALHPRLGVESPLSVLPKELFEAIIAIVARRTRGTNFPPHKKQRVETELLDLLYTKLREGQAFRELTFKALARELADIARTLAGDDEEINLIAANHPHAFSNMVTVLFQNEFRKGAAKERLGARTKGSSAASSRGFARVLANFAPSDDPAADMAQFWRRCVDAGLGEDKLKAVRLMRHFQSAPDSDDDEPDAQDAGMQSMVPAGPETVSSLPSWLSSTAPLGTVNVEETAGRPLFGGAQPGADNLPEFSNVDDDDFMLPAYAQQPRPQYQAPPQMFASEPAQQQQMTYAPQQVQQPQHRSLSGDNIGSDGPLLDYYIGSDDTLLDHYIGSDGPLIGTDGPLLDYYIGSGGPLLDDYIGSDGPLLDDGFLGCFSSSSEPTPGSSASSPSTTTPAMA